MITSFANLNLATQLILVYFESSESCEPLEIIGIISMQFAFCKRKPP